MLRKNFFRGFVKQSTRYFGTSSPIATYKISAQASSHNSLKWVSGNTNREAEVKAPLESLLGALAGCENSTARYYAKQMGMDLKDISMKLEADYDKSNFLKDTGAPNRFSQIRMEVEVEGNVTEEDLKKLHQLVNKYCPIASMLTLAGVDIQATWKKK